MFPEAHPSIVSSYSHIFVTIGHRVIPLLLSLYVGFLPIFSIGTITLFYVHRYIFKPVNSIYYYRYQLVKHLATKLPIFWVYLIPSQGFPFLEILDYLFLYHILCTPLYMYYLPLCFKDHCFGFLILSKIDGLGHSHLEL